MKAAAGPLEHAALLRRSRERLGRVQEASDAFFQRHADDVSRACRSMAERFHRDGRLLVFGDHAARTDAYHVSVEFVHPVLVGKRALPALVLEDDPGRGLRLLGRPEDVAMGISSTSRSSRVDDGLGVAEERGLLTVALDGGDTDGLTAPRAVDHRFAVNDADPMVVQEVQETLYHVLWELVHVFLDHREVLE